MAKDKSMRQVIFTVEEDVYEEFKEIIKEKGETPTTVFRKLVSDVIVEEKLKNNVMAGHFEYAYGVFMDEYREALRDTEFEVSLIPFNARGHFRKSESISEDQKEEMVLLAEELLQGRMSDAYDAIKYIIDKGEFLELPDRGAYKPVIVKSLAGFALVSYDLEMENKVYGDDEELIIKKRD